ncbi:MAG: hypothetical protein FWF29_13545, partial [Treponema sp.]|nr:hypothetical protein [Treponema sp.]
VSLPSAEIGDDLKPALTVTSPTITATRSDRTATMQYAVSASSTNPGDFSASRPSVLKDKDNLWIEVTSGNTVRYYVIAVTVVYDENAGKEFAISLDPVSRNFTLIDWNEASSDLKTLTVELSEPGSYQYQWYSNTAFSNSGGQIISGATAADYAPAISAVGNYYYYVTVSKSATDVLTSSPAWIQITDAAPALAPTAFAISSTRLNYVRGIGGTGSFMFRAGNGDASPDADVTYIDLLCGDIGCNVLRIMVQDDYLNYIKNAVQSGQSGNNVVFYHDAEDNFFPVIRRVNEYGGYVFANPWTAPASMKVNNALTGGLLIQTPSNYVDYAEHLRNFLKWLNTNDAPIFALGILNEPDFGQGAGYEGMGMSGTVTRDWFQTVGNFTTQQVTNKNGAGTTTSVFADDIIPGYGGGGATHHVLAMSGDSMGDVATYMNPQLDSTGITGANNRIELIGRHYYSNSSRYTRVTGDATTAWSDRPQLSYAGPYESASLAASPQMYAPGSAAGNIKREIWQTEHDFNYASDSTHPPSSNVQNYWNSTFAAMNDIDWALRVMGESVFTWWYTQSFSGFVTSYQPSGFPPYTITPRGRGAAHYARYVNETWFLPVSRTRGTINFNTTTSSFNAGATDPKISAYEDVNGKFISVVMFTPTYSTQSASGGSISAGFGQGGTYGNDNPTSGSTNVGRIAVTLPDGFVATGATAMRSYGNGNSTGQAWDDQPSGSPRYWITEPVFLSSDGKTVEVTLPGGNIISIKITGEWSASYLSSNPRYFESRPQWKGRLQ